MTDCQEHRATADAIRELRTYSKRVLGNWAHTKEEMAQISGVKGVCTSSTHTPEKENRNGEAAGHFGGSSCPKSPRSHGSRWITKRSK
jgi:hypothetical protein